VASEGNPEDRNEENGTMSEFFKYAMRYLDWDGPFARSPHESGIYEMFCHELINAGCDLKNAKASACYILSAMLSKAIQENDFAIKIIIDLHDMTNKVTPAWDYDLASEGHYDHGERISIPFTHHDTPDSDGSVFYIWGGGSNGRDVAQFTSTKTKLGPLVQKSGMMFGPREWIAEQREGWSYWPESEEEGTGWGDAMLAKGA
jgi:hypothetical protein